MEISKSTLFKVRVLDNQAKRLVDKHAKAIDKNLTGMQLACISFIGHYNKLEPKKDIYPKDIEIAFNIRRSTITTILKNLEKGKYITQVRSSSDERYKKLFLTKKSEHIYQKILVAQIEGDKIAHKGLTQEKIDTFLEVADIILHNISQ